VPILLLLWRHCRLGVEALGAVAAAAWGWIAWQQHCQIDHVDTVADAVHEQVARLAVEQGAAAAHLKVQQTYAAELSKLTEDQEREVSTLAHDPAALARCIVQMTNSAKFPSGDALP
jgi:hypothetical protein